MSNAECPDRITNLVVMSKKRRSPRMCLRISMILLWEENGEQRTEMVHTVTVSWFGCAIRSYSAFRPGSSVLLYRNGQTADANIVYCLQDRMTQFAEVGLEFVEDGRSFWEIPEWNQ
jgi:hypothetical protein